jgi:hypothetical protein
MTLIEQIKEVMGDQSGSLHVDDIALMIVERYPNFQTPLDELPRKISSVLSTNVKKKSGASFTKVKNKQGGLKRGIYRLKKKPSVRPKLSDAPSVTTQYTGKAGEAAVISELLFYGFNASAMTVDDGIDVVASKNNKYYHIQVKTANPSSVGGYGFSIKKSSFNAKDSFQTFYIFVIRGRGENRYYNDYLILPSNQIKQFIGAGVIKDGANFSVRIEIDKQGSYKLNAKQDVTISINTFDQLI